VKQNGDVNLTERCRNYFKSYSRDEKYHDCIAYQSLVQPCLLCTTGTQTSNEAAQTETDKMTVLRILHRHTKNNGLICSLTELFKKQNVYVLRHSAVHRLKMTNVSPLVTYLKARLCRPIGNRCHHRRHGQFSFADTVFLGPYGLATSYGLHVKAVAIVVVFVYASREKSQACSSTVHNRRLIRRTVSSATYRCYLACR